MLECPRLWCEEEAAEVLSERLRDFPVELESLVRDLDEGKRRVCSLTGDHWTVHEDVKQAIISLFSLLPCRLQEPGKYYDKIPLKFEYWEKEDFEKSGIRVMPGAVVRYGAFLAYDTVVLNSFVNIGAYIDSQTMVDSFATIGACAQIGKNCHIASGAVIGGVLEPLNACPVIIEDDCFIGAHACVVEGVVVKKGATIAMGTRIGASTKIIERDTGKTFHGEVPENAVVVPGSYQAEGESAGNISIQCAVIIRYGQTRHNTQLNANLRICLPRGKNG
jgi:2,3,4,5-tetrahydropyridine-2-carboxylate N-succinyltransferase